MKVRLKPGALAAICHRHGGISLERLAAQMGVSPSTVYRADRGDHVPSNALIARLLVAAGGMPFEAIFEVEGEQG